MNKANEKFAIIREIGGRQMLFFKDVDDEGEPAITTKIRTIIGITSLTGTMADTDARDKEFNAIHKKPDSLLQEMFEHVDAMAIEALNE